MAPKGLQLKRTGKPPTTDSSWEQVGTQVKVGPAQLYPEHVPQEPHGPTEMDQRTATLPKPPGAASSGSQDYAGKRALRRRNEDLGTIFGFFHGVESTGAERARRATAHPPPWATIAVEQSSDRN